MTHSFEALPELALLTHSRGAVNRLIMPISNRPARALLPGRYEETPPPFSACLRVGTPLDVNGVLDDFKRLAKHCRTFSFWSGGPPSGKAEEEEETSLSPARRSSSSNLSNGAFLDAFERAGGIPIRSHRAGNWTVISARPKAEAFVNEYNEPPPPASAAAAE